MRPGMAARQVGYCQGMNFVAAVLLLALMDQPKIDRKSTEENAFWILAAIVEVRTCLHSYCFCKRRSFS
jgi:hypothetical protein